MLGRLRQSVNYKPAKCCVPDKEMIKFNFNSLQISFNLVKNLTYERCCKQNIFTNSKTAFIFHIRNYVQLRITVLFPYPSLALINKPIPKRFCSKRPRDVKDTCYCNIHRWRLWGKKLQGVVLFKKNNKKSRKITKTQCWRR